MDEIGSMRRRQSDRIFSNRLERIRVPTLGVSCEDVSCSQPLVEEREIQVVENTRLRSVLEHERHRQTLRSRTQSGTATLRPIHKLETGRFHVGIIKVEDKIYVLSDFPSVVKVFEDANDFRFLREIALNEIRHPCDIVYSRESKCFYISDCIEKCIWIVSTTGEQRPKKWLTENVTWPYTLCLSNKGHLLVLRRRGEHASSQLEVYSLTAKLIQSFDLPQDIKNPLHVVQTWVGNFIITHGLNKGASGEQWVISQLASYGQLINRFVPRSQEELKQPQGLCLDLDNSRLFVADYFNNRVILFDSNALTWSQVLLSDEINGVDCPYKLFYGANRKHLFVAQSFGIISVFEIN